MKTRQLLQAITVVMIALPLAGCGKAPPPLAPVRGRVTYEGRPLSKVRVEFHPEVPINDPNFVRWLAQTDDNGEFVLVCDDGRTGATVGWHRVVLATDSRSAARERNPFEPETGRETAATAVFRIPKHYNSVATTPEKVEVKVEGENRFEFKVKR